MEFIQEVKEYYFNHLHLLSERSRFHFASRMAAWFGDQRAYEALKELRTHMLSGSQDGAIFAYLLDTAQTGKRVAHDLRLPYFERFSSLYGAQRALFRLRHLKYVYGQNSALHFLQVIDKQELAELRERLRKDRQASRILSTYAVNYTYLVDKLIFQKYDPTLAGYYLSLSHGFDETDPTQLQLLLYMLTHSIICESNFYIEDVKNNLEVYQQMLKKMEILIRQFYSHISLDNKLEFLVCARLCKYRTGLSGRIYEECANSISTEGSFVIDIHNTGGRRDRQDFQKSEHRSVLLIMSATDYEPHSTEV